MSISWITDEMRAIVGKVMRETVSYPVAVSDIRKWAMAVYWPAPPPRLFWDEDYAARTEHGGIVAPEDFNPFAWMSETPSVVDQKVAQTGFSEAELGVTPPKPRALILTEIRASHGKVRMRPGDVIRSTHRITEYFEREGRMGYMLYTTVSHELTNQHGDWIRTVDSVFLRY